MKIGQVAKLLEMPVETIRFYEKNQILSPGRRENSTYRDFEVWEIFNLFDCIGGSVKTSNAVDATRDGFNAGIAI